MAWIDSFEIVGLAGREKPVVHKLNPDVNIFWGLNGAGKTTLLKILHAALNADTSVLGDLHFESAEIKFKVGDNEDMIIRSFSKKGYFNIDEEESEEVFISGEGVSNEDESGLDSREQVNWDTRIIAGKPDQLAYRKKLKHSYLPITRVSESPRRYPSYFTEDRKLSADDIFVREVRDTWREYSAKSLTRIRDIQQQGLATVLAILFGGPKSRGEIVPKDENVGPNEAYDIVRKFLSEQDLSLNMEKSAFVAKFENSLEHREVVTEIQAVRSQMNDILAPQREFQAIIDSMYSGNKRLVLARPRASRLLMRDLIQIEVDERAVPLKFLSSGEKQLLQILLEVLGASTNTVMIDEPELSMHVNWQQKLVASMIKINSDCQLILASHSPEIMADVPDRNVFEL